jgi:hypothetical protein
MYLVSSVQIYVSFLDWCLPLLSYGRIRYPVKKEKFGTRFHYFFPAFCKYGVEHDPWNIYRQI